MGLKLPATTVKLITAYFYNNRLAKEIINIIKALFITVYRIQLGFNLFRTLYLLKTVRQSQPALLTCFYRDVSNI